MLRIAPQHEDQCTRHLSLRSRRSRRLEGRTIERRPGRVNRSETAAPALWSRRFEENRMRRVATFGVLCVLVVAAASARAENAPGVTATEIKLGQTMSYTGPVSVIAGPIGRAEQAYFRMINDQGGINGRKIVLESLDDGFDAAKALNLAKKMVEQDHVAAFFSPFATPQNLAIRDYANRNGIPDLFIMTGDDWVIDHKKFPWTIGGIPVFRIEAQVFGRYILSTRPPRRSACCAGAIKWAIPTAPGSVKGWAINSIGWSSRT
jgi:ABC-type branched-subunit amino acid transport system substrate-binding protein